MTKPKLTATQIAILEALNICDYRDHPAMAMHGGLDLGMPQSGIHGAADALVGKGLAEKGTTEYGRAGYRLTPDGFGLVSAIAAARAGAAGEDGWTWDDLAELTGLSVAALKGEEG